MNQHAASLHIALRHTLKSGTELVKVKVTLRLMDSESVSRGVEPYLWLMTRYLLLVDSYSLVFVGRAAVPR
jgi:hypothetical protein